MSTRVRTCIPYWRASSRWQMSRLVSDSVPVHRHHWLSAASDSLLLVTELSRSTLQVSGTVCQILWIPHLPLQSSGPALKLTCLTFLVPPPPWDCAHACAVTLVALDTIIVLACLLTYLPLAYRVGRSYLAAILNTRRFTRKKGTVQSSRKVRYDTKSLMWTQKLSVYVCYTFSW